jgi:uncharacterized protein (TIGR00369 family)
LNAKDQFTGPHEVNQTEWVSCAPFEKLLNLEILEALNGRAQLRMPFLYEYAQGAGLMHGGALVGLADTAAVMAIKTILPPHTHFATIKMTAEYLKPVKKGYLTAQAEAEALSDKELKSAVSVSDEDKQIVLKFSALFKRASRQKNA